ncbi:hypothetical protein QUB16_01735 [Microcoleus sp. D3_18a_C4]
MYYSPLGIACCSERRESFYFTDILAISGPFAGATFKANVPNYIIIILNISARS